MAFSSPVYVNNSYLTIYIQYIVGLRKPSVDPAQLWASLSQKTGYKYLPPKELFAALSQTLKGDPNDIPSGYLTLVSKLIIELHLTVDQRKTDRHLSEEVEAIWFDTRGIASEIRNNLQAKYPVKDRRFFKSILELGKQLEMLAPWIRLGVGPIVLKNIADWLLN